MSPATPPGFCPVCLCPESALHPLKRTPHRAGPRGARLSLLLHVKEQKGPHLEAAVTPTPSRWSKWIVARWGDRRSTSTSPAQPSWTVNKTDPTKDRKTGRGIAHLWGHRDRNPGQPSAQPTRCDTQE